MEPYQPQFLPSLQQLNTHLLYLLWLEMSETEEYNLQLPLWRSVNNQDQSNVRCDQNVNWDGWYRFYLGGSSAAIPDYCVAKNRCGTHATLYITQPHPTQINEIVTRTVCSNWGSSCCNFPSHTINIKLCPGNFYVYKLAKPSVCHLAYCTGTAPSF
uniref:UMOD/GP2/OIT3-like D8C domain-containing protein n=1 Tax=Poecilia mexicana TaxID=48701 RepID=A0A3B3X426_9TELE